ncbi:DUF1549 domain-containing protein [Telmatocola sphagniphila]|uniref:DUF1549 domain-containing protein n=1 Tax=Telmatocola sphagniphila TaxID=1123043 RepID=A0A8E6EZA5_9BACT|nr:DUF1549 and DUF1553 domain-containing protein [Telmatocola sphagniphila]QVL33533.1 DUF1549 domain-containing protein [Telmatocola sphagniphila]
MQRWWAPAYTLGLFVLLLLPLPARSEESPSFQNEIIPLLTRQGCNQGSCHGKSAGQNGFRLSLRGYAPDQDFQSITREFEGRRIDRSSPERSLLLKKSIGDGSHAGGKLFETGSREYQTLLNWIRAGTPGPIKTEPRLTRLEISPSEKISRSGETYPIQVFACWDNGQKSEVTWLTQFQSNDASQVTVEPKGLVHVLRSGATAIRASFLTEVAVSLVTVPSGHTVPREKLTLRNNQIDDAIFKKLDQLGIEPAHLTTDAEFLRRVSLDLTGTLPTPERAKQFLQNNSADKRSRLIEELLNSPEFVDFWTLQLDDLLQNRKERDHDVRGNKGVRAFHGWIHEQVARNRPWNELVREVISSSGSSEDHPEVGYYIVTVGENRHADRSEVVASVAQAFLGTRIGCAQCHNHPLERYTQDDYYHFAAYFSRIKIERKDSKEGPSLLKISHPDENENKKPVGVNQPRTGQFLKPQTLDRKSSEIATGEDPRRKMAAWIVDPRNEAFAGAMVNRLWKHFFAVGLVEPVDDIRATNPPSNPELWNFLVQQFIQNGYDLRKLMRIIVNSRSYQVSATTCKENETDQRFYSHYYARRLPAEVLADAIAQVTLVPDNYNGYPQGIRAIQIPDAITNNAFLGMFGKSERVTACACERNGDVTLPQLLHLQNGEEILRKFKADSGRLKQRLKTGASSEDNIRELFLSSLTRFPTEKEVQTVQKMLNEGDSLEAVYSDLLWALLNSKDFAFNH